jgi:hypothetical protein
VTRFGIWIEKHWPEKMTAEEVRHNIEIKFDDYNAILSALTLRIEKLEKYLEIFKTQSVVKSRIVGESPSTMTPFASRLKPVQPATGGNGSPQ